MNKHWFTINSHFTHWAHQLIRCLKAFLIAGLLLAVSHANTAELSISIKQATAHLPVDKVPVPHVDFESYLGKQYSNYVGMPPYEKKVFHAIYHQILSDNGETVTFSARGKTKEVATSKGIQPIMKNLSIFLYHLDAMEIDMVDFYDGFMKQIKRFNTAGLYLSDDILHTLYGAKILAEQVDKIREGFLNTPAQFSAEREKMKQKLKEIQAEVTELERQNVLWQNPDGNTHRRKTNLAGEVFRLNFS